MTTIKIVFAHVPMADKCTVYALVECSKNDLVFHDAQRSYVLGARPSKNNPVLHHAAYHTATSTTTNGRCINSSHQSYLLVHNYSI